MDIQQFNSLSIKPVCPPFYIYIYIAERYEDTLDKLRMALNEKDYSKARNLVIELRYWHNILHVIKEWSPGGDIRIHH